MYLCVYQLYIYGSIHVLERHAAANKFDLVYLYVNYIYDAD